MDRLDAMAQHMWDARRGRKNFANLPDALKPATIAEAYQAQEVYHRLAEPVYGQIAGVKVAVATKVMQQLMGITHPCGGAIFARTIHTLSRAHSEERLHQPAHRERDRAQARAGHARCEGAVDGRERGAVRGGCDAGLRADRGP